jgi:hypothetical protein
LIEPKDIRRQIHHLPPHRRRWARRRLMMEDRKLESTPRGPRWLYHLWWLLVDLAGRSFYRLLHLTGQASRGRSNALNLQVPEHGFAFSSLPEAFEGFRILLLTDLHLDGMDELVENAAARLENLAPVDLLILGGDFKFGLRGPAQDALDRLKNLLDRIDHLAPRKIAILGNHDSVAMLGRLEEMGLEVLINQSVTISRGNQRMSLVGVDDVHCFYSRRAAAAMAGPFEDFTIALVHSPELAGRAEIAGADLYLCGHTHGGQICLPGPVPLTKHLTCFRRYWAGLWRRGTMQGLTSRGVGVSGIFARFNAPPEAWLITLKRDPNGHPLSQ